MTKKIYDPSEEDSQLFRNSLKKITVIKNDKFLLEKKSRTYKRIELDDEVEMGEYYLSDHVHHPVLPNEQLFFTRQGVSAKQLKALRQGKIPIRATLDLHGYTSESAKKELVRFIDQAYKADKRCICIIHGKGHTDQPVLKNKINLWLKQFNSIIAFCSSLPMHGGTGAVYVLLRANRNK